MSARWLAALAMVVAVGCGSAERPQRADETNGGAGVDGEATDKGRDPCTLVAQAEMERFIGPLAEPPYRVSNRYADPEGSGCLYRARDHRNVTLEVEWEGGTMTFRMMAGVGGQVEDILGGRDMSADTLELPWDEVALSFGQLVALRGDVSVQLDPLGSRMGLDGMAEVMGIALGRVDAPLAYDGGRASRVREGTVGRVGDPCSLVTRTEVEALMGPLRADPHPAEDGRRCVYPLALDFLGTPVDRILEVQWTDGFYALGLERQALGMASTAMSSFMGEDQMPELGEVRAGEAPWDERVTLLGGVVTIVKADVLLKVAGDGVGAFGEDEAVEMLRLAAERIR